MDLVDRASRFDFGGDIENCADFYIERRSGRDEDSWAVMLRSSCLSRKGELEWEPRPSSRTEEWIAANRFTRAEAVEIAERLETHLAGRPLCNVGKSEWTEILRIFRDTTVAALVWIKERS